MNLISKVFKFFFYRRTDCTIKRLIVNIFILLRQKLSVILPAPFYLKVKFYRIMGCKLNLKEPKTFNEKIQWLKLYDHKSEYTTMTDKYKAREYINGKLSNLEGLSQISYLPKIYGVWLNFSDINFDELPDKFVLKANHDSGSVFICTDKQQFNIESVRKKINHAIGKNYYWKGREYNYKNIKPRLIFAEEYLGDNIHDYKFFAFNGSVKAIQVDFDRFGNHRRNIYTTNWEYIPLSINYPTDSTVIIEKPMKLDEMIKIASYLSKGLSFIRVDFFYVGDRITVGELTFHHGGGMEKFTPYEWCIKFGEWITLPK